jgi:arylsulfatase
LFVSIDTLRADHLGSYGYPRPTSPNLDRLAAGALVFRDVLAQAPSTAASHGAIFSGRYVHQGRKKSLARILSDAGYRTAGFVDGGQMRRSFGLARGFEHYESTDAERIGGGLSEINPRAIAWLDAQGGTPFFLFLHTYDVHCPYDPPEPYRAMFLAGRQPSPAVEGRWCGPHLNRQNLDEADFEYLRGLYDAGIRYTDEHVQQILTALGTLGLADETVVVVTSDHAESLGERGWVGHNQVYSVQLKVPLIVALPSGRSQVVDSPVESIDILPTLLAILGVEGPGDLPGKDLTAQLERPGDPERVRLAQTWDGEGVSVHEGKRWSLVTHAGKIAGLYDLLADPEQLVDRQHERPDVAARLARWLRESRSPADPPPEAPPKVDERTRRELEALGYAEP